MLNVTVTAPVLATNCYVVGADDSTGCVVVDPGIGAADTLINTIRQHNRTLKAILITHGHLDHTFAAGTIQRELGAAVMIHEADRYRLDDPFGTLGPQLAAMVEPMQAAWVPPSTVTTVVEGDVIEFAGLSFAVRSMPGHTEGSAFYIVDDPAPGATRSVFTGDVLFAGTIGRTDLPGGDDATMRGTLTGIADPNHPDLRDDTVVLPGHGPTSTIGAERATNPFLRISGAR